MTDRQELVINIVATVFTCSYFAYTWSGMFILLLRSFGIARGIKVFNTIWKWSKYPALVACFANPAADVLTGGKLDVWDYLAFLLNIFIWWYYRNMGDDDWTKKAKEKLTEVVREIQGKLVLVPQAA